MPAPVRCPSTRPQAPHRSYRGGQLTGPRMHTSGGLRGMSVVSVDRGVLVWPCEADVYGVCECVFVFAIGVLRVHGSRDVLANYKIQ